MNSMEKRIEVQTREKMGVAREMKVLLEVVLTWHTKRELHEGTPFHATLEGVDEILERCREVRI